MREVKRDFPWFSITEYEKEAAYLRRRHKFLHKVRHYDVGVKTINKFNPIPYSTLKNSYFVVYRRGLGNI